MRTRRLGAQGPEVLAIGLGASAPRSSPSAPWGRGILIDSPPDRARGWKHRRSSRPTLASSRRTLRPTSPLDGLRALAAEMDQPAASLAIAWLLAQGEHVLPIPGTRNPDHLAEAARGAELDLSAEDLARVEDALPVGWTHGERDNQAQWKGSESYC